MFVNTHALIAQSILNNIDNSKSIFISEKNFIFGNIKPDICSKYLFKKHYLDETFDMIISKINYLCSLTINNLSKYFSISRLSQELGIICHFLCDFFCVPHSYRWEFKHSMKKHLSYETELSKVAKDLNLNKFKGDIIKNQTIEEFFNSIYKEYVNELNHKNDLYFSTFICNSVINYILDCILINTVESYTLIKCV